MAAASPSRASARRCAAWSTSRTAAVTRSMLGRLGPSSAETGFVNPR